MKTAVALFLGGLFIVVGVVGLVRFVRNEILAARERRRIARLLALPVTPIHAASVGRTVHIRGRIQAAPEGLVHSPLSQHPAVWCRARLQSRLEGHRYNGPTGWADTWSQTWAAACFIDDGSGELAGVSLEGATILVSEREVPRSQESEAFLRAEGVDHVRGETPGGTARSFRMIAEVLSPGAEVEAIGYATRAGAEPLGAYRHSSDRPLLTLAGCRGGPRQPLVSEAAETDRRIAAGRESVRAVIQRTSGTWGLGLFLIACGLFVAFVLPQLGPTHLHQHR